MSHPNINDPTEKDQLLPQGSSTRGNATRTIYTIPGPPPPPPPYSDDPLLPTTTSNGVVCQRDSRRRATVCGTFAKAAFTIFAILLLARPLMLFWQGVVHGFHGHSGSDVTLRPLPGCRPLQHVQNASFSFDDPRHFTLREFSSSNNGLYSKRIGGKVFVGQGRADQTSKIEALIMYGSAEQNTLDLVTFDASGSSLTIDTSSQSVDLPTDYPNLCLSIDVYLSVAPDTQLDALGIDISHLALEFKRGLSLAVAGTSSISTHSGSVSSRESVTFRSRETIINVDSGSVSGQYALLDLLLITTKSGSIAASVAPGKASDNRPAPASFVARSGSGSIHITYPTHSLPEREYRTEVIAGSGSVSGTFIHGSRTFLKSISGSVSVDVTPFDGDAKSTSLTTESHSAHTSLKLHEPHRNSNVAMSTLQSRHTSVSGGLTIRYPRQWEGTIDGSVVSGSLDLHGSNLKIIRDDKLGSIRRVKATKGEGDSSMHFETVSGSASIIVD